MSTEPGQLSPDGRYRWDGKDWQPADASLAPLAPPAPVATMAPPQPLTSATTPIQLPHVQKVELGGWAGFRLGFFAFFGAGCASLVFWVLGAVVVIALGGLGAVLGNLGGHTT